MHFVYHFFLAHHLEQSWKCCCVVVFVLFLYLDLLHFVSTVDFRMDTVTVCKHWCNSCFVVVIIIMIVSKAQILKKSSALYKEYDGRQECWLMYMYKNQTKQKLNIYIESHPFSLSQSHTHMHARTHVHARTHTHSKHRFPAPYSKLCQIWLCHWRGTLYLRTAPSERFGY